MVKLVGGRLYNSETTELRQSGEGFEAVLSETLCLRDDVVLGRLEVFWVWLKYMFRFEHPMRYLFQIEQLLLLSLNLATAAK